MVFTSAIFIFGFLPVVLAGFWLIAAAGGSARHAVLWLLLASLAFYAWWHPPHLALLLLTLSVNYAFGEVLKRYPRKAILVAGIAFNLLFIGYFKYLDFLISTVAGVTGQPLTPLNIVMPLAISFFSFQQIAYLTDTYRGQSTAPDFIEYCLFLTFFPHAIAGPLMHHRDIIPQFHARQFPHVTREDLIVGLIIFLIGFNKKVVVADSIATIANPVFDTAVASPPGAVDAWAGALAYTFQIYFDFSGYSDMAIGLARMFGLKLPINFDSPYRATSIIEFWRRWHITLSRFLRDYLYMPLGGNRQGQVKRYINLMIVMLLGGLWHGAGWTFVIWGGVHGLYLVINHAWIAIRGTLVPAALQGTPYGTLLARGLTFAAVVVAWVFFRAENIDTARALLSGMAGLNPGATALVDPAALPWLAVLLLVVWVAPNTQELMARHAPALYFENRPSSRSDSAPRAAQVDRVRAALSWRPAYWLVPFISGTVVIAALLAHARGVISTQFIYMIF